MRRLTAEGLALEPQVAGHADEMFSVLSDPAIYLYENTPPPSLAWLRERFRKLESRRSADDREQWLNWVVRLPSAEAIGYVQATIRGDQAGIAYVLGSRYWGRGHARQAVEAMLGELADQYEVRVATAVLKTRNVRSRRLLDRLGFIEAIGEPAQYGDDETLMRRSIGRA